MPLDHYVTLGRSGLRVSPFCLGTMTFGEDWGWGSGVNESRDILARYLALGGNFIDTANVYTKGHSEAIIGDWFHKAGGRAKAVLATKFFGTLYPGDPNAGGAGRKSIMAACENSLRRLKTDYIDLYWLHCWDVNTPFEETMRTLDDLVRAGKVRYLGFSDSPAWRVARAQDLAHYRGWTPLIALQIEYSLLQRTVEGELIPAALELGLGVTPWSPLKYGILTGKYTRESAKKAEAPGRGAWVSSNLNESTFKVLDTVSSVAMETGASVAEVALSWVQNRPAVASTIIGARTLKQLEQNLKGLDFKLTAAQTATLDEATKPAHAFPYDFVAGAGPFSSGGCTINGVTSAPTPMAPRSESEVY